MRRLFHSVIIFLATEVQCLSGPKWNHEKNGFISISAFEESRRSESRIIENYNFKKEPFRLLFHQDSGIISSYDNDTKVTGFFGELWSYLSEYRNFTLIIKKVREKRIGIRPSLNASYIGQLRYIESGSADVIPKMEVFLYWSDVVNYFLPIWNDRCRLFTRLSYEENIHWLGRLFPLEVWLSTIILLILFCMTSISMNYISKQQKLKKHISTGHLSYIFYYCGLFIQRSFYLIELQKSNRILNTSASLFSMIFLAFYGSRIIDSMINKVPYKPFEDFSTLHNNTKFVLIAETDTVLELTYDYLKAYKDSVPNHDLRPLIKSNRVRFSPSRELMYRKACAPNNNYVIFESENLKKKINQYQCKLKPLGKPYYSTWIASGVRKNFKHKRSIDLGILKLFESGIFNAQKKRLIGIDETREYRSYESINMQKLYIVIKIYEIGVLMAFLLLIIEKIRYFVLKKMKK